MTSTRDTGRPQSLKITVREALREARARRQEGKPALAAAALDRAAEARETLVADYLTPALERELTSPKTAKPRRRDLAAHLLGSAKPPLPA
jgi:hypothetical protein